MPNHLLLIINVQQHRLQLMKTQALPSAPLLRGPVDLLADPALDPDLSKILFRLAGDSTQSSVELNDPRFVLNGITIQVPMLLNLTVIYE